MYALLMDKKMLIKQNTQLYPDQLALKYMEMYQAPIN
jgi:hypothetical protein